MISLKQKSWNAVVWSLVDNIANTGVTFIVGVILARLLLPSEFGILGMITVFLAISNSIIDSGFSQALIRKQNSTDKDYNTVFIFNITLSVILFMILYFSAPYFSKFFNEVRLTSVARVMAGILIINSVSIIHRTILTKEIDFKSQTKISLIASISSGMIAILLAYCGFKVWSLVVQLFLKQLINTIGLWIINPWRPSFRFSFHSFKELFGFGSKLLVSGLIDTIYKNVYYLIIGRFYSANLLGQYTRAEQFASMFSSNLTSVVQKVSYPAFSSIQQEDERLKQGYRKVIKNTMLITFMCMLGLAAIAKPLILLLIGDKWVNVILLLQLLCIAEMLFPLHAININILNVKGKSDLILKLEIIKKCIAIPVIASGIYWGINFMLFAYILSSFISFFLNSYFSSMLINYSTSEQIIDIAPSLIISIIISGVMLSFTIFGFSNLLTLILQLLTGGVLAMIIFEQIHLAEFLDIKVKILSFFQK